MSAPRRARAKPTGVERTFSVGVRQCIVGSDKMDAHLRLVPLQFVLRELRQPRCGAVVVAAAESNRIARRTNANGRQRTETRRDATRCDAMRCDAMRQRTPPTRMRSECGSADHTGTRATRSQTKTRPAPPSPPAPTALAAPLATAGRAVLRAPRRHARARSSRWSGKRGSCGGQDGVLRVLTGYSGYSRGSCGGQDGVLRVLTGYSGYSRGSCGGQDGTWLAHSLSSSRPQRAVGGRAEGLVYYC